MRRAPQFTAQHCEAPKKRRARKAREARERHAAARCESSCKRLSRESRAGSLPSSAGLARLQMELTKSSRRLPTCYHAATLPSRRGVGPVSQGDRAQRQRRARTEREGLGLSSRMCRKFQGRKRSKSLARRRLLLRVSPVALELLPQSGILPFTAKHIQCTRTVRPSCRNPTRRQ